MNRYVAVLGPWSSGSTAVAGVLDRLGAYTCPPHHRTPDPRTPNAYEPQRLREILLHHVHEPAVHFNGDRMRLAAEIDQWLQQAVPPSEGEQVVALKHPLLAVVIPVIQSVLSPQYIVIRRPYEDIEKTAVRRKWGQIYGYMGARLIYERMYSDLLAMDTTFLDIYYPTLLAHPEQEIDRIAEYTGLDKDGAKRQDAYAFVRRP